MSRRGAQRERKRETYITQGGLLFCKIAQMRTYGRDQQTRGNSWTRKKVYKGLIAMVEPSNGGRPSDRGDCEVEKATWCLSPAETLSNQHGQQLWEVLEKVLNGC
jgi:hypothetical protein